MTYTVQSTDTLASAASNLAAAISANTNLAANGVRASASSTVVEIKSTSINATTYTAATSGGATETINLAPASSVFQYAYNNVNALTCISAGGVTYFQGLSNKALQSATINSTAATLNLAESFSGDATLISGNNAVPVSGMPNSA